MTKNKELLKRIVPLIVLIAICLTGEIAFIRMNVNYQNNVANNSTAIIYKENKGIINEGRYKWCSALSCTNFSSYYYVCAKGEKINIEISVRDQDNHDSIKNFKLSNNNITKKELSAVVGGEQSVYKYEISCEKIGMTEMHVLGSNGKSDTSTVEVIDNVVPVRSIKIDKDRDNLHVGETRDIIVNFNPVNASNKSLRWYTSDSRIVKVNQSGKILAVAPGMARVTAIAWNDDEINYETHIDIVVLASPNTPYAGFNLSSYVCAKGKTITVKSNSCYTDVTNIYTENKNIVKISNLIVEESKGDCMEYTHTVECVSPGQTNLYLTDSSNRKVKVPIKVVNNYIPVRSISLGNYGFNNIKIGESFTLSTNIYPPNTTNKKVYWSSSNPKAFIVDQTGTITAIGKGKSKITAKIYYDDKLYRSDTLEFNAYEEISDLSPNNLIYFSRLSGSCKVGNKKYITLHLSRYDSNNVNVVSQLASVRSLNKNIVTVDKKKRQVSNCIGCIDYEITCKKAGTGVIEAISTDGGKATYTLNVK